MKKSFIFPGQGSQIIGMCKEFYENFDLAKKIFEEINQTLNKDLKKIMFEGPEDLLNDTENTQPAIMTASIIILNILQQETDKTINELCDIVAGHSLGEYSALCASNVFTISETANLLKIRGKAFSEAGKISNGGMVALVGATIEQAEEAVLKAKLNNEVLQVANDNTVGQVVISGSIASIENSIKIATEMGIKRAVKLVVSGAFHSELMKPAVNKMEEILNQVQIKEPTVQVIANYTADFENKAVIKSNLLNQLTGRVRWRETMLKMEQEQVEMFVEIGSSKILSGMVAKTCPNIKVFTLNSIDSMKEFIQII